MLETITQRRPIPVQPNWRLATDAKSFRVFFFTIFSSVKPPPPPVPRQTPELLLLSDVSARANKSRFARNVRVFRTPFPFRSFCEYVERVRRRGGGAGVRNPLRSARVDWAEKPHKQIFFPHVGRYDLIFWRLRLKGGLCVGTESSRPTGVFGVSFRGRKKTENPSGWVLGICRGRANFF